MNWQNLSDQKCPHCGEHLEDRNREMRCTSCLFHVEYKKYHQIRAVQQKLEGRERVVMRWQDLKNGKCPMCGGFVKDSTGKYNMTVCNDAMCPFKIRDDDLERILQNPEHPINKYL